ncbi:conserved hypothetical protein [Culex quinquefasciatus]|uniref:Gamma-interferon inducible lysosomal thiol reductase n=1 Tax=Culex quinquefasciatus TaxID=7176 RepID=B0WKV5_CULQU|nr:conserved hypothetical protein [Culex quinquefasciatus]|eukprot:XP_001849339.1 conserved hypothetical protein [Culex quinquefasciatus]
MKRVVSVLFVLTAITAVNTAVLGAAANRVKVTLYYEHLCPDSIRWVSAQLVPNYNALRDFMEIEFIPFGKAKSINGGESFQCQHGPKECQGNMLQACVLHYLPEQQDRQVSYVTCQMNFNADPAGWQCAEQSEANLQSVRNCDEGVLRTQLLLEAERRTQQIPLTFVPTVVFNGKFDQTLQDRALKDFREVMCELTNKRIIGC